jgi:hypothetical protein
MLPSISQSHDHPYSKSLSQTMTVSAHRRASVKIHTSGSMASTINTSRSESLFWPRRCNISGILTVGDDTLAVSGGTLMVDCSTLTAGDGTLAVSGGILTIDDSTLMISGGTLTSDGQHRLSGAIISVTQ